MSKHKIAIVGATGYTGSELVRILINHPEVEIAAITSESRAGERFSDVHHFFQGICELPLIKAEQLNTNVSDLAFLALPHGVSMDYVEKFADSGMKLVDLSGDFRLSSPTVYNEWYPKNHTYAEGFEKATYGIPELYGEEVRTADLVANPGCYPTSAILAITPLLASGVASSEQIIIDAKSGVTGAGIKSKPVNHFSAVNDNFKAYGIKTHRHSIEIQENADKQGGRKASVQFTPHLLPVDRGILATSYLRPKGDVTEKSIHNTFEKHYSNAPFIRLRREAPSIKDVRGTNYCDIFSTYDERTGNIIVISAIDNLVKGAAGQAVQNMNLMLGLPETARLNQVPVQP
ncbi:MAG: N-acetyl-gamma-glutamyl-phosphate reductase [Cryomorphaceae bacterium]